MFFPYCDNLRVTCSFERPCDVEADSRLRTSSGVILCQSKSASSEKSVSNLSVKSSMRSDLSLQTSSQVLLLLHSSLVIL